jgi:dsRNA-specific ribonuclease
MINIIHKRLRGGLTLAEIKEFENILRYRFVNKSLLIESVIHRVGGIVNYKRPEFLGDSIAGKH